MEPLFLRFANGDITAADIAATVTGSSEDPSTIQIAKEALKSLPDLSLFRRDFSRMMDDLIDNGINQKVINYINSYMKPSLEEYVEGSDRRTGEKRWVSIKAEDTPWMEAIVCYNLCLYIRGFGISSLKHCPVCHRFFAHKGKYGKYCSDPCKQKGNR